MFFFNHKAVERHVDFCQFARIFVDILIRKHRIRRCQLLIIFVLLRNVERRIVNVLDDNFDNTLIRNARDGKFVISDTETVFNHSCIQIFKVDLNDFCAIRAEAQIVSRHIVHVAIDRVAVDVEPIQFVSFNERRFERILYGIGKRISACRQFRRILNHVVNTLFDSHVLGFIKNCFHFAERHPLFEFCGSVRSRIRRIISRIAGIVARNEYHCRYQDEQYCKENKVFSHN